MRPKDLMVMRSLINLSLGRGGESQWTIIEQPGGDLTLIDVDDDAGQTLAASMGGNSGRLIAFTRDRATAFPVRLGKPLRSREFLSLLEKLADGHWPGVGQAVDADGQDLPAPDPVVDEAVDIGADEPVQESVPPVVEVAENGENENTPEWPTFAREPDAGYRTLAEHLRLNAWRKPGVLTQAGWPLLVIDPGSGAWFFDGTITDLKPQQFAEPIPDSAVVPISNDELVERIQGHRQRPLSELKWFAGLAQSRGQLHPDLVGDVEFMLTQVPAEAMKSEALHALARLLIRGPMTADSLLEESGHTREDISAFLNACYTSNKLLLNRLARVSSF
ncbi:MAG: hypothetical protein ACXIUL_12520 [Wenzhouxiangella sp.]